MSKSVTMTSNEHFFVLEVQSNRASYCIKLTKMGWDMLSASERKRLISLAAGKQEGPTKWNHRSWGSTTNEAYDKYKKSVERWKKENG